MYAFLRYGKQSVQSLLPEHRTYAALPSYHPHTLEYYDRQSKEQLLHDKSFLLHSSSYLQNVNHLSYGKYRPEWVPIVNRQCCSHPGNQSEVYLYHSVLPTNQMRLSILSKPESYVLPSHSRRDLYLVASTILLLKKRVPKPENKYSNWSTQLLIPTLKNHHPRVQKH